MKSATLKIEGMHCDGCAQSIQKLVAAASGVRKVSVSFKDGEARVLFDPKLIDEARLAAAIEKAGFRVASQQA